MVPGSRVGTQLILVQWVSEWINEWMGPWFLSEWTYLLESRWSPSDFESLCAGWHPLMFRVTSHLRLAQGLLSLTPFCLHAPSSFWALVTAAIGDGGSPTTHILHPGPSLPCTYALSVYPSSRFTEPIALNKEVHRVPQITITSKWDIKMYFLQMIASKGFTPA